MERERFSIRTHSLQLCLFTCRYWIQYTGPLHQISSKNKTPLIQVSNPDKKLALMTLVSYRYCSHLFTLQLTTIHTLTSLALSDSIISQTFAPGQRPNPFSQASSSKKPTSGFRKQYSAMNRVAGSITYSGGVDTWRPYAERSGTASDEDSCWRESQSKQVRNEGSPFCKRQNISHSVLLVPSGWGVSFSVGNEERMKSIASDSR